MKLSGTNGKGDILAASPCQPQRPAWAWRWSGARWSCSLRAFVAWAGFVWYKTRRFTGTTPESLNPHTYRHGFLGAFRQARGLEAGIRGGL